MIFNRLSLLPFGVILSLSVNNAHAAPAKTLTVGALTFEWEIKGKEIAAKVSAHTDAWVAIGFMPTEKMKDANIVMGSVKGSQFKIENDFGTKPTDHAKNTTLGCPDLVKDGKVTLKNGVTEMEFKLPLDAQDKCHKPIPVDKDIPIIFAYGKTYSFLTGHPERHTIMVNLSTGAFKEKK